MTAVAKEKYFEMWRGLGKEKGTQKLQADFLDAISQVSSTKKTFFYTGEGTLEPSTYKRKFNVALYVGTSSLNISYFDASAPGKKVLFFRWRSIMPQLAQCSCQ